MSVTYLNKCIHATEAFFCTQKSPIIIEFLVYRFYYSNLCVCICVCFQGRALLVARSEQEDAACRSVSSSRGDVGGRSVCSGHQPAAQTLLHPHWTRRHGPSQELGARRPYRQVDKLTDSLSFIHIMWNKTVNRRFYYGVHLKICLFILM